MAYAALTSLKLTIERLTISSQIPFLPAHAQIVDNLRMRVDRFNELLSLSSIVPFDDVETWKILEKIDWATNLMKEMTEEIGDTPLWSAVVQNLPRRNPSPLESFSIVGMVGADSAMEVKEEIIFFIETAKKIEEQLSNSLEQPKEDDDVVGSSRTEHLEGNNSKIFGLDHDLVQLKDLLLKDTPGCLVVTIVGMAGIGKTTLVNEIYKDPDIVSHFECRAFISVGQNYALQEIILGILAQTNPETDEIHIVQDEDPLHSELLVRLRSRRYLIVLDDIWDYSLWRELRSFFPNEQNGSRIIVTTRLERAAIYAGGGKEFVFKNLLR
ncbi:putative late blight resistance proteinR1B-13 [Sesamum alatum]|uniref:Late blight resistance proteinR1B-13 n=1 Tax=Sesamum alatum TaxID=300844 RepID=A0AAE1YB93_9LAMI|nr:putative late blight resistance proteinR1B-13 [Sesamum alatum]